MQWKVKMLHKSNQAVSSSSWSWENLSDVLCANQDSISFLPGLGDGNLETLTRIVGEYTPAGVIAVARVNADANDDLVTASDLDESVTVRLGLGDGTFAPPAKTTRCY